MIGLGFFGSKIKMVATRSVFLWGVFFCGGDSMYAMTESFPKKKHCVFGMFGKYAFLKRIFSYGKWKFSRFPVFACKVTV